MKEGWEYKTLGECCEKINGLWKGKKEPFVNVGVIRNANFTKEMTLDFSNIEYLDVEVKQYNTRKLKRGDLIVEKSGGSEKQPVGRAVLFLKEDGDYSFSNFTSVLRIINKDELLYEFLYKFLLYIYRRGDTKSMQKATTGIHNIEFEKYLNIQVPIIPKYQQRRIVSYLDSSFQLIDEIKEKAQKSLSEAKALFQSALAEAMEPKEGWEYKKLIDVCDFQGGSQPPKSEWIDHESSGYVRMLQIRDFTQSRKVSPEYVKLTNRTKCCFSDDILIGRYGASLGKILSGIAGAYNVAIMRTIPNETLLSKGYLKYYLMSSIFQSFLLNIGGRAAQAGFNKEDLKCLNIPLTTLDEQSQIVSHLDKLSSNVKQMEERYKKIVEECDALKQAMLRDVFE